MRRCQVFLSAFLLALLVAAARAAEPQFVSGTYLDGSNRTEPRPNHSRFLETLHGGILLIGNGAGFYLLVKVRETPTAPLLIRVEYEDPAGGPPAKNDMEFLPQAETLMFSSPSAVHGLKIYSDYLLTVRVYENKDSTEPLDVLKQTIRSYVDTTAEQPKLMGTIKARN